MINYFCLIIRNTKINQILNSLAAGLSFCPQFKIFNSVVHSNSVFVVDIFKWFKFSSKELLKQITMFLHWLSFNGNLFISILIHSFGFGIKHIICFSTMLIIMIVGAVNIFMSTNMTSFSIDLLAAFLQSAFRKISSSFNKSSTFQIAVLGFYHRPCRKKDISASSAISAVDGLIGFTIFHNLLNRHIASPFKKIRAAVVHESQKLSRRPHKIEKPLADFVNTYSLAQILA